MATPKLKRHPSVSVKAVRVLNKVKKAILEEPRRLEMGDWGRIFGSKVKKYRNCDTDKLELLPPCKTTACIAGHVLVVTQQGKKLLKAAREAAKELLGKETWRSISFPENTDKSATKIMELTSRQAYALFHLGRWGEWKDKYDAAMTPVGRAKVAIKRIDHFITTGE